jgi:hypothetical protein
VTVKRFKDVRKTDRFTDREGFRWFVTTIHRKAKEVTAWRCNYFYEHLFIAGKQLGSIERRFRISEINRLRWEGSC